jgi:multicomponent Na+:H+ antiporter subunit B
VAKVYIENGLQDTGAVNIVTGMILSYRAFDTFGETNVLFIAASCVMILLMVSEEKLLKLEKKNDRRYEPKNDVILQTAAKILCPVIFMFGFYVMVNGHLSPGGGFSGGAMTGAGLILYVSAFGFEKMERFFNEKVYKVVKVASLCTYGVMITYYFIMGANGLENHIPLGKAGAILSSGLILPINICVGLEVACTMYAFYALFRRGGL